LFLIKLGLVEVVLTLEVGNDLGSWQLKSLLEYNAVGIDLSIGLRNQVEDNRETDIRI
jgi:hypothetical protein